MTAMASCCLAFVAPPVIAAKLTLTQLECEQAGTTWKPNKGKCKRTRQRDLAAIEKVMAYWRWGA